MSKGIVLFGINNEKINYIQLAIMAAGFIKKNMPGIDICLITDADSHSNYIDAGYKTLRSIFKDVVLIPNNEQQFINTRAYRDTRYYYFNDSFKNETRSLIYELSPYDETLLMDSDYLVCSNELNAVWGNEEEIMINKNACGLLHNPLLGQEFRLNTFGIKMYWATVVYFRKGPKAKALFDLVQHIKDNWDFYKLTYEIPGTLFRNDYAFSIAIHMLNGFVESNDYVVPLPVNTIHTALDTDQFFKITSPSDLSFFVNDVNENWKFYVSRLKNINVHCMNKLSLMNNMDTIMGILDAK